jgi:hypothetical protein
MNFQNKQDAREYGKKLILLVNNPEDWDIDVWENFDWHVSLNYKHACIMVIPHTRPNGDVQYDVYCSTAGYRGADNIEFKCESSTDINQSLKLKMEQVKKERDKMVHLYDHLCFAVLKD